MNRKIRQVDESDSATLLMRDTTFLSKTIREKKSIIRSVCVNTKGSSYKL